MARPRNPNYPSCPRCGERYTISHGVEHGAPRWLCQGCRRTFCPTTGTPLHGLKTPLEEVANALLIVQLTQAIKHHQGRRLERVEVRATIGEAVAQPYPVHVERANGVLRDRLNCLTRQTHAFAKTTATWDAAFGLVLFAHHWLHPHLALRQPVPAEDPVRRYVPRTPAMAIGLTDHRWTWPEFLLHRVNPRR